MRIVCQVENATSYLWYKYGKLLERKAVLFKRKGRKLVIRKFSETDAGVYQCVGKDGKGNFGKTAAKLSLEGIVYTYIYHIYLCLYQGEIQDDIKAIFFVSACYRFLLLISLFVPLFIMFALGQ